MIVLSCGVHDPEGGLAWMLKKQIPVLQKIFGKIVITATKFTNEALLAALREMGCQVIKRTGGGVGLTYRAAIQRGHEAAGRNPLLHLDFDRALHWARTHPEELARIAKRAARVNWFVGERTARALRTHPKTQIKTETEANRLLSKALGEDRLRDYISTCWGYSRAARAIILRTRATRNFSFYGKWNLALYKAGIRPTFISCDGLAWETPDHYRETVAKAGGIAAFRAAMETAEEWERRWQTAREILHDIRPNALPQDR